MCPPGGRPSAISLTLPRGEKAPLGRAGPSVASLFPAVERSSGKLVDFSVTSALRRLKVPSLIL